MPTPLAVLTREVYRRELIPARARWWLAAKGMGDWYRILSNELRPHLGDEARPILQGLALRMFERRYEAMRAKWPGLPDRQADQRALGLLMSALYRIGPTSKAAWILGAVGGPPHGIFEKLRGARIVSSLSSRARWEEVATHLGELLIVLTEELPAQLPHARRILGDICFQAGVHYAERLRSFFDLPKDGNDPAQAIELLRTSEYIFHVNPKHWGDANAESRTGWLEGSACPWYARPGWNAAHCGIFGQFQAGITSVFGLRYHLAQTIPKHGGETCRVDLKPIQLRRSKEG